MTISFRSAGASAGGINSITCRAPATVEPGDLILWFCVNKYPPAVPATPTGYAFVAQASGGDGVAGADTGDVTASWFSREAVGDEDAATQAVAVTGGNATIARSAGFWRDSGSGWAAIAATSAVQAVAANTWELTTGAIDVAAGDMIVIGTGKNSDQDLTHSYAISASGITFGAISQTSVPSGTTQGDDCASHIAYARVTSGSGTVPLSITITMTGSAGSTAGVVSVLRLRESGAVPTPVEFSGPVPTLTGKQGVAFSQGLSGYFAGSFTPFIYTITAGALPAGLTLDSLAGTVSGTPTVSGTARGIVVQAADSDGNVAVTNAITISLEADPTSDVGYYAVAQASNAILEHTTASHSFNHAGAWWTLLRVGANWGLYQESGNVPGAPGGAVDWTATPHLADIHAAAQCTVCLDAPRNRAFVVGFGSGAISVQFRELTYSGGAWTVTASFNVVGSAGVGLGATSTFSNQGKLSIGCDGNGVPYLVAGNRGSGAAAANGCHIAWPDSPASLGGTWSAHTIDASSITEGDASGRFAGVVSQAGVDYLVVSYTEDATDTVRMAYHAVETTLSNYGAGWTVIELETALSVDNHVWAGVMAHGGEQVVVTVVKDGDGSGAGQLQLITSQLGTGMTWTHKRHRVTNGIGDPVPVQESPSRPCAVLDQTNGEVWVFYHARDSHPYGWVGYKRAALADLLAATGPTDVFDIATPRNTVVAIYDASLPAAWNVKTPAHPVAASMGYFPITAHVAASAAAGDAIWHNMFEIAGGDVISVSADITGDAATSAALATRITAASTVLGVSSVDATLSTQLTLAADVLGVADADGALYTEIRIPADVLGSAAVAAALATRTTVAALIEGAGDVAGQISIGVTISADALGAALVDAGIVTRIQLAGQVAGESTVVARLAGDPINVEGDALGSGAVDGLISTRIALPAEILGAGMLEGGIVVRVPMGAIINGVGQVSAGIVTAILAGADVAGSSNVQAVIVVTAGLSARPHPDWTIRSPGHAYRVKR